MPTRIEIFDRCVAVVFAQLYERFPVRTQIDFTLAPEELFDDSDEITDIVKKNLIFGETVRWLQQAGYIWVTGINEAEATEVVLTPKSLELLKAVPGSLSARETFGELIVKGVRESAKESVRQAVSLVLAKGLGLVLAL